LGFVTTPGEVGDDARNRVAVDNSTNFGVTERGAAGINGAVVFVFQCVTA